MNKILNIPNEITLIFEDKKEVKVKVNGFNIEFNSFVLSYTNNMINELNNNLKDIHDIKETLKFIKESTKGNINILKKRLISIQQKRKYKWYIKEYLYKSATTYMILYEDVRNIYIKLKKNI